MNKKLIAAGIVVGGLGLWYLSRRVSSGGGVAGMAESAARGLIGAVEGAAVGTVKGIGAAVGIPDTNKTTCQADVAAGRWWDASFSCPAGTFVSTAAANVFGSSTVWDTDYINAKELEAARARAEYALIDPRRIDTGRYGENPPEVTTWGAM